MDERCQKTYLKRYARDTYIAQLKMDFITWIESHCVLLLDLGLLSLQRITLVHTAAYTCSVDINPTGHSKLFHMNPIKSKLWSGQVKSSGATDWFKTD